MLSPIGVFQLSRNNIPRRTLHSKILTIFHEFGKWYPVTELQNLVEVSNTTMYGIFYVLFPLDLIERKEEGKYVLHKLSETGFTVANHINEIEILIQDI